MKRKTLNFLSIMVGVTVLAQFPEPLVGKAAASIATIATTAEHFSEKELDALMGPIALYPDPLLAQVIPAATFVDQVVQANTVLKGRTDEKLIQNQTWDVSVKSVAHYPQVLEMMATQRDWTTAVGQAYVYQSTDVMKSIQRLRAAAKGNGTLVSTSQQTVTVEKEYITIVPAQPQVIYVPVYDPQVVYVSSGPPPGTAAIAFGMGLAIGAWLNRDWHWYGPGIYYHGWVGAGWISVNRVHVHVNHVYVNRSFTQVNVNRTIVNRDITHYRADLNTRVANGQHLDINRGNISRDFNSSRPATTPARTSSARKSTRQVQNTKSSVVTEGNATSNRTLPNSSVRSTPRTRPTRTRSSSHTSNRTRRN